MELEEKFGGLTITDNKSEVPTSAGSMSVVNSSFKPTGRSYQIPSVQTNRINVPGDSKMQTFKPPRKGPRMKLPDGPTPFASFSKFVLVLLIKTYSLIIIKF